MYEKIVIAGTPGVGKSTIAGILAKRLDAVHVDLSRLALEKKLFSFYDEERQSYVIDEYALVEEVRRIIEEKKRVVIDTHYPEILPSELVDIVIVLRLHPRILEDRLRGKKWSWRKIRENVMAEILSVVTINAIQKFGFEKVYEVDATNKNPDEVLEEIYKILNGEKEYRHDMVIDWLTQLSPEEISRYEREEEA
jgi:adenylate kinase